MYPSQKTRRVEPPTIPTPMVHHLDKCESEIEKTFLSAYARLWQTQANAADATGDEFFELVVADDPEAADGTMVWLMADQGISRTDAVLIQPAVPPYRPDFMLWRWYADPLSFDPIKSPRVIVECDGHDFHDKTREQAARDKSRDRELQAAGFYVLRFTGSELWRNAPKCAREVDQFLTDSAYRAAEQRHHL